MGPIAAGAISGGSNVLGAGIGAITTGVVNKKNRKFAENMYNRQLSDSWSMWNAQNEYNSPVKQMQRLRSAGVNPLIPFMKGSMGAEAGSPSKPSPVSYQGQVPDFSGISGAGAAGVMAYYDTQLKKAHTTKVQQETDAIDLDTKRKMLDYINEQKHSAENANNRADILKYDRILRQMEQLTMSEMRGAAGEAAYGDYGHLKVEEQIANLQNLNEARSLITQQIKEKDLRNKKLEEFDELVKNMPQAFRAIAWMILIK